MLFLTGPPLRALRERIRDVPMLISCRPVGIQAFDAVEVIVVRRERESGSERQRGDYNHSRWYRRAGQGVS